MSAAKYIDHDFENELIPTKRRWSVDKEVENVDLIEDSEIDAIEENLEITILREKFSSSLSSLEQLRPPEGLATGIDVFDDFLLWGGLPKGDLTLLNGKSDAEATSLATSIWMNTAQKIHAENKAVAWINSDSELLTSDLVQKKFNLKKLSTVKRPKEDQKEAQNIFEVLQELISSSLFELVGCHLPETLLKNQQLQKLKKLARIHQVALVIISPAKQWANHPLFSLVIDCARDFFTVKRALHRPTPFFIQGSVIHANFRNQFTSSARSFVC